MDLIHPPRGASSLAVGTVIAMIFLLHPEGFFWTAVDAIVQLVMGGTRTIARIPLLLRENKIVAILLILWVFALLAIQRFKEARTVPLEARSPHSRKMKRKRPGRRLSGGGHDSSRAGGRNSPNKHLEKSVGEDEEEEEDNETSLPELDLPASTVPYQVEKQDVPPGRKSRASDRGGGGGSTDTASVSSEGSSGSFGGGRSRSGRGSSGGGSSGSKASPQPPPSAPPSSSPSYGSSAIAAGKGGAGGVAWKHGSPPGNNLSMPSSSGGRRTESQSSRSARPNRPFAEDFHHQQQHHKKRLGSLTSSSSGSSLPPSMTAGSRAGSASKPAGRGGPGSYSAGAAGSLSPTPASSAWSSGSPVSTRLSSPHGPQHQARSPFSSPQQRPQQPPGLAVGAVWQGERKAWGSPLNSKLPSTMTPVLDSPTAMRLQQHPLPPPQHQQPPQQQRVSQVSQRPAAMVAPPPGFLSVKAEPFQPSGRVLTPTNSHSLSTPPVQQVATWTSSYGSVYQPPSSNDNEDSRLEMSMFALSQSVSMSVLGGDL